MTITHDESTWPTGDRVWDVCRAIARAEGANVEGSNPDRLNNPGDISDGRHTYGSEFHSGSYVTIFPDKVTGWHWLYAKVERIKEGDSHTYLPTMSWAALAHEYAASWVPWLKEVTQCLGVNQNDAVGDYFGDGQ
jgi:hypothetical protein